MALSFFHELRRRNVIRVATAYAVTAWLIIQIAETVLPFFDVSDDAIRNVIVLLAIGFIPTVVLAWTFKWTPEGIKRDSGLDELASDPGATRTLDRVIIFVLIVGISYFAYDKFILAPKRAAVREAEVAQQATAQAITGYYGDRSIAVLPFENMSADPEQQYFADGVAEEVLNLLARIRQLRVISRSSSFALRDLNLEVPEIAQRLDVGHVLEGSVRKSGNAVRVTIQLIEARTDTHLWSKTYDRDLDDVFAIQDEIAADVAGNLHIEMLRPLPASRKIDSEAVALTQQARMLSERQAANSAEQISAFVDRALEADPGYVSAWEQKAWADLQLMHEGLISAEEEDRRYRETRRQILELEPESAIVDTIDGLRSVLAGSYEIAASLLERAISKAPNSSEPAQLGGGFAREIGRFDTAIRLGEHSVAIDPLCFFCLWQLSESYYFAGDYDNAARIRNRYLALGEGGEFHYGQILLRQGKLNEALEHFESMDSNQPYKYAGLSMTYHELGNPERAEEELARLMSMDAEVGELPVANAAAWLGEKDVAFEWLERAAENQEPWNLRLLDPSLKNLHDDPRWGELLESVGFSPARLDAIEFNPVLPH